MLSRCLLATARVPLCSVTSRFSTADAFKKRTRGEEEAAIRQHERDMLIRLKEQVDAIEKEKAVEKAESKKKEEALAAKDKEEDEKMLAKIALLEKEVTDLKSKLKE